MLLQGVLHKDLFAAACAAAELYSLVYIFDAVADYEDEDEEEKDPISSLFFIIIVRITDVLLFFEFSLFIFNYHFFLLRRSFCSRFSSCCFRLLLLGLSL